MFTTRSRPELTGAGRTGICDGVMPQPSGSSGRYHPALPGVVAEYASPSTCTDSGTGSVVKSFGRARSQPVYGACMNTVMPAATAAASVDAHCQYEITGKKSEPSVVTC